MYPLSPIIWLIHHTDLDVWDDISAVRVRMLFTWSPKKLGTCRAYVQGRCKVMKNPTGRAFKKLEFIEKLLGFCINQINFLKIYLQYKIINFLLRQILTRKIVSWIKKNETFKRMACIRTITFTFDLEKLSQFDNFSKVQRLSLPYVLKNLKSNINHILERKIKIITNSKNLNFTQTIE